MISRILLSIVLHGFLLAGVVVATQRTPHLEEELSGGISFEIVGPDSGLLEEVVSGTPKGQDVEENVENNQALEELLETPIEPEEPETPPEQEAEVEPPQEVPDENTISAENDNSVFDPNANLPKEQASETSVAPAAAQAPEQQTPETQTLEQLAALTDTILTSATGGSEMEVNQPVEEEQPTDEQEEVPQAAESETTQGEVSTDEQAASDREDTQTASTVVSMPLPKFKPKSIANMANPKKPDSKPEQTQMASANSSAPSSSQSSQGSQASSTFSENDSNQIISMMRRAWNPPPQAVNNAIYKSKLVLEIDPEGNIISVTGQTDSPRYNSDNLFRATVDSAIAAGYSVERLPVPEDKSGYENWRKITLTMDPSAAN